MSWGQKYDLAAKVEMFFNQCHQDSGANGGRFCDTAGGDSGSTEGLKSTLSPKLSKSLGIHRADMPQFSGVPKPGSKASTLNAKKNGEVDARAQFRDFLSQRGIKTTEKKIEARNLTPAQKELDYDKVARYLKDHKEDEQLVVVSSDNYVLDGTHHWAANYVKDSKVRAIQVDATIKELLPLGHEFDKEWGLTGKALTANG